VFLKWAFDLKYMRLFGSWSMSQDFGALVLLATLENARVGASCCSSQTGEAQLPATLKWFRRDRNVESLDVVKTRHWGIQWRALVSAVNSPTSMFDTSLDHVLPADSNLFVTRQTP
jgi:hypothetical protein